VLTLTRRLLEGALALMIVGVLAIALAAVGAPRVGYGLFAVRTASMTPALHVGDLVLERHVDPEDIRPGDVITVATRAGATVTHRVVSVTPNDAGPMFTTMGDANPTADPVASRSGEVRGRVETNVPLLGFLLAIVTTPSGLLAVFSIGAMLLVAIWLLGEGEASREDAELAELARRLDVALPTTS
jgi:signal peptidase I